MNRIIKFRGRLEETGKIIFFELGEVVLDVTGLFSEFFDDYVVDIEQFIATDKNGFDVYEGDKVIRIAGEDFIPEKTFPMSATFDDFSAIRDGKIVLEVTQ